MGVDTYNRNPRQEHFLNQGIYADNNNSYALDNLAQYAYNDYVQNYLFKNKTSRELSQTDNNYQTSSLMLKNPNNASKSYGLLYYPVSKYMEKVEATQLSDPIGWKEGTGFLYEQTDPRNYLPSVMETAAIAKHIYGQYDLTPAYPHESRARQLNRKSRRKTDGWRLIDVWEGRQGMKMGFYIKDKDDWLNPSEYIIAFKGSSEFTEKPMDWVNNFERHFSSKSADMWDAINCAKGFSEYAGGTKITFVGHSKGGAEAAAAAVATNRDAVLFNPANTNLKDYDLDANNYTGNMVQYVVGNEILSSIGIGPVSPTRIPTIRTSFLIPKRYSPDTTDERIYNHSMDVILDELKKEEEKWKKIQRNG
uniref:Fungal lipase-like domain-containing protein n=1 Tax=uncultured Bacillota bacterium TaxID=344338 RepID=A0A650EPC1_9FIRM|nr:hypothetical protein Firmicute1046_3580 [uncultured Firmicutes bacterium]